MDTSREPADRESPRESARGDRSERFFRCRFLRRVLPDHVRSRSRIAVSGMQTDATGLERKTPDPVDWKTGHAPDSSIFRTCRSPANRRSGERRMMWHFFNCRSIGVFVEFDDSRQPDRRVVRGTVDFLRRARKFEQRWNLQTICWLSVGDRNDPGRLQFGAKTCSLQVPTRGTLRLRIDAWKLRIDAWKWTGIKRRLQPPWRCRML